MKEILATKYFFEENKLEQVLIEEEKPVTIDVM
jgi:hypothetical protein